MVVQKCNSCSYFSKSILSMKIHKRRHQSQLKLFDCEKSNLENFSCENCDFTTQSISLFSQHSNCKVKREEIVDDKGIFTKLVYNSHNIELYRRIYGNLHKCKKCPYATRSIFFLLNHVTRHQHPRIPFNCENFNLEQYFCEKCQFSTNVGIHFREHIKHCLSKGSMQWFECEQCEFKTRWRDALKRHVTGKHTPEDSIKWFECKQCEFKTQWTYNLKAHITNKHTLQDSIKWFQCQQCDHKTKWRNKLKQHITNKHTPQDSIKWFQCQQCDHKTKWRNTLKQHINHKHTPEDSINWLKCQQCEFKTKWQSSMKSHITNQHTPERSIKWFECNQCDHKTKQKSELKKHVTRKHTSEGDKSMKRNGLNAQIISEDYTEPSKQCEYKAQLKRKLANILSNTNKHHHHSNVNTE